MESTEVIDIDELLGDGPPKESLEPAEEYDFEGFLDDALHGIQAQSNDHVWELHQKDSSSIKKDKKPPDEKSSNHNGKPPKFRSNASSSNYSNSGNNPPSSEKTRTSTDVRGRVSVDGTVTPNTQQEAMLDSLSLNSASQDTVVSEEDLIFDVNSEELKQFILEFQEETKKATEDHSPNVRTRGHGPQGQRDNDSLSSLSTCESSHDDSLSSSLASGDYQVSPDRVKLSKAPKGKSMRVLMASLLSKNRTQQSDMLGSEDENKKDGKKIKGKTKRDGKSRTTPSSRSETSSSTDKLRQILGEGDWEKNSSTESSEKLRKILGEGDWQKKLKANGLTNSESVQAEAEGGLPRESSLPKQVLQAAIKGDQGILEFLLLANRELSVVRDGRGNTLLHTVCKHGHLDCLKWLSTGFCSGLLTMENDDCFTPADLAVKHGHLGCLSWLVQETECKSELHPQDNRWSLLHVAARFGQEGCLRWLLGDMQVADIPIDLIDHTDNTPAHLAAKYGHLNCLQTLVEFNADITMVNKKKQTPCILATKYHHEMCAQFLVVVETCITLSEQVITLQRQLRESHEERRMLKHKLKNTLSCTEALVNMHKTTDTLERVQQVRQEYVDLTNLLVKRLDDIHLEKKAAEDEDSGNPDDTVDEVSESKRKAAELETACQNLLEEEEKRRQGDHGNRIQEIEDQLGNIAIPKTPRATSWPVHNNDNPVNTLDLMRARLSEVSHGLAVQGPSLSEESMDDLSLSSSYASSLSSSCSSLTTLMRTNGSLRASRRRKVTWTDEAGQSGKVVVSVTSPDGHLSGSNTIVPPYAKILHKPRLQRQRATVDPPPSSPETGYTSSSSKQTTHPLVQYDRTSKRRGKLKESANQWSSSESFSYEPKDASKWNEDSASKSSNSSKTSGQSCSKKFDNEHCGSDKYDGNKCDVAMATNSSSGMVKSGDGVDLLVSSRSQSKSNYENIPMVQNRTQNNQSTGSKPDRTHLATNEVRMVQRTKSESDMSLGNADDKLSIRVKMGSKSQTRSLSVNDIMHGCPSPPAPFEEDPGNTGGEHGENGHDGLTVDSSEDENDPFGSSNVLAMQEAMKHMRPAPIVENIGNSTENLHQLFAKHLPPQQYDVLRNVPEHMRKMHRSNGNIKPTDTDEDVVVVPPLDFADKRGQTLKRLNSDSSISSTSSTATWSETDQQESPTTDRTQKRGGILSTGKKNRDGKKSKSEKHITFALDTDLGDDKDSNRKSAISKRRDLSPIYEAPDLLRLSRNGGSVLRQNILSRKEVDKTSSSRNAGQMNDAGKTLEERLYRLFSYSSDDDNESSYSEESTDHSGSSNGGGGHIARKDQPKSAVKMPPGLSDEISAEFEAMSHDSISDDADTNGPRMWYESSEEEEEEDENEEEIDEQEDNLQNSTVSFDGHICYL